MVEAALDHVVQQANDVLLRIFLLAEAVLWQHLLRFLEHKLKR